MNEEQPTPADTASEHESTPAEVQEPIAAHPFLGSAGLFLGALIACLAFAELTIGLPLRMPRSWYVNRPLWYFLGLVCFVVGCLLLRNRRRLSSSWRASRPGVRFQRLVLYTWEDCHLCDQAKDTLVTYSRYLPTIEEVDIGTDPQLLERYRTSVPVVEIDGKVRFRGLVNEALLRTLIEATPPRREQNGSSPKADDGKQPGTGP